MAQTLAQIALVVDDYDKAVAFYCDVLGFMLVEDTRLDDAKRWVVVRPAGNGGAALLLAKAAKPEQLAAVGNQTGGRVFLFLHTDRFDADYASYRARGVEFVRGPDDMPYGRVAVFRDLYGNLWDLIGLRSTAD